MGILQAGILEWVAMPSSRGSSQPGDWTHVSCTGRWILYHWTPWEAHLLGFQLPASLAVHTQASFIRMVISFMRLNPTNNLFQSYRSFFHTHWKWKDLTGLSFSHSMAQGGGNYIVRDFSHNLTTHCDGFLKESCEYSVWLETNQSQNMTTGLISESCL